MTQEVLKLALEWFEKDGEPDHHPVVTAIKEALAQPEQEPVAWRELCRRLYVELFHCDQQMMAALDEDGYPIWQQGKTVRDVLTDAKTALETFPPQPEQEPVAHIPLKALEQIKSPMLVLNNVPIYGYSAEGTVAVYTTPPQRTEQEPVAYLCENAVGHKYFRWKKPSSTYKPIALYTTPPQRTERPVDCERCNRLEEQAYDLVGKLRVANIKLSMQPQRTWVDLTDDEIDALHMQIKVQLLGTFDTKDIYRAVEAKLKEKNNA